MAKPRKPRKSSEQIAAEAILKRAHDMEAVNLPPEAASLSRQRDIEITRAGEQRAKATDDKKVQHDTARRLDAFEALKGGFDAGCYDAARRLERDLLARLSRGDRAVLGERVDGERGAADRAIFAGERVDEIRDRIPQRDFWLLTELIDPPFERDGIQPAKKNPDGSLEYGPALFGWRAHVYYITGERHTEAQAAAVRAACVNLRDAYTAIERKAAA